MSAETLLSVGIDLGTTTTQLVFSRLTVRNEGSAFSVPNYTVAAREVLRRSAVHFTPLRSERELDAGAMARIVDAEYAAAGIDRRAVQTGAVIITGETARRENARACREAVQGSKRSREAQAGETSPAQSLAAWHAFAGQYFPALVDRPAVVHGGGVLLPVPFPQTNLHVLRAGVFVGSVQKGRFVPEHHLFTAFGAQCVNREELTLDDPRCVEYLSGREVEARIAADGWCCVTVDGWPLGGGKVSGGRVKNHYPKALRLL